MSAYFYAIILYALLAGGGYLYYKYASTKIDSLQIELVASENRLKEAQDTVDKLTNQVVETTRARNVLTNRLSQSELEQKELVRTLQEHDLTKLAAAKPGLIENILNEETRETFNSIESITRN